MLAPVALAGDSRSRVTYVGGTVAGLTGKTGGFIQTTDESSLFFFSRQAMIQIPFDKINLLEYGQQAGRRIAEAIIISPLLLLSKKRKHYLTIGYTDDQDRQQAMVFQVDKNHVRALIVSLEAKTGRKVEYQDNEARKAGKG